MVVDSSALLAVLFNENYADWVSEKLNSSVTALRMSTVNYAEVLILIEDDRPQLLSLMETQILSAPIRLVPPTVEQAEIAARRGYDIP